MDTQQAQYYQALKSRDARFDGRFFVGVSSTGIYCRPVCRVKLPKLENCHFFHSAALAEENGFRPCLRCRPEQAPGLSLIDSGNTLVLQAARLIDRAEISNTPELAKRLGISERHLRRLFQQHYGVSPSQYLRTRRLLIAKTLLMDTQLPVSAIALHCGFGSQSQFYQHFQQHYQLTPSAIRRNQQSNSHHPFMTFQLAYRPPYDWQSCLAYLAERQLQDTEWVTDTQYCRTVMLMDYQQNPHYGWIRISHKPERHALFIEVADTLQAVVAQVLAKVADLFDLHAEPESINQSLQSLSADAPGLRIPGCWDGFELATRAILGQQISIKAARTLANRLVEQANLSIEPPWPQLNKRFPSAVEFLKLDYDELGQRGIIRQRITAIDHLAQEIEQGTLNLSPSADWQQTQKQLLDIPGIGPWTMNYIAMRALRYSDAFPAADYGVKKSLQINNPKAAEQKAEIWRPWRSYAVMHLWRKLA